MINRFRNWLHRDCRRENGLTNALMAIGGRLAELSQLLQQERPELVTVIAFGERDGFGLVTVDSKKVAVGAEGSTTIELENHWPVKRFHVVVLANLDRVDIRGVFRGVDLLSMVGPVTFGDDWQLGAKVRVVVELRR